MELYPRLCMGRPWKGSRFMLRCCYSTVNHHNVSSILSLFLLPVVTADMSKTIRDPSPAPSDAQMDDVQAVCDTEMEVSLKEHVLTWSGLLYTIDGVFYLQSLMSPHHIRIYTGLGWRWWCSMVPGGRRNPNGRGKSGLGIMHVAGDGV